MRSEAIAQRLWALIPSRGRMNAGRLTAVDHQKDGGYLGVKRSNRRSSPNCDPVIEASFQRPVAPELERFFLDVLHHLETERVGAMQGPGFLQAPVGIGPLPQREPQAVPDRGEVGGLADPLLAGGGAMHGIDAGLHLALFVSDQGRTSVAAFHVLSPSSATGCADLYYPDILTPIKNQIIWVK